MTAEENIASLALFVRPRIHEIMNRWWILESLKSIRNQRHDLSFLMNLFIVQKSWLKVVTFFKTTTFMGGLRLRVALACLRPTPAVWVWEKVTEWKLSEEARDRREGEGPSGLVTFTFSQPAEPLCQGSPGQSHYTFQILLTQAARETQESQPLRINLSWPGIINS